MASSVNSRRNRADFPAAHEILWPSAWQNRGSLVGPGQPESRQYLGGTPSLLAIHGFGGTPREVDLLIDVAEKQGLSASAPLLPGHGTQVRELSTMKFEDWLNAARSEFDKLRDKGNVILAGLSLGAVIAARLAADANRTVLGLVLLANAIWLKSPYPAQWLAVAEHLHLPKSWWIPKLAPDIADPERRVEHLGYDAQPIAAAIELYRAGRETRKGLGKITCPTLLIHGALDNVCPVINMQRVTKALGTRDTRCVILEKSGHIVTRDREREIVRREFAEFLVRIRG
jgi:carboxylesterase